MPNWTEISKCPIWKVLGVIECNDCRGHDDCWPESADLPEMSEEAVESLRKVLEAKNGL